MCQNIYLGIETLQKVTCQNFCKSAQGGEICQFVLIIVKNIHSKYKIIFVRNGAKAYVKNPPFFSEKNLRNVVL